MDPVVFSSSAQLSQNSKWVYADAWRNLGGIEQTEKYRRFDGQKDRIGEEF